MIELAFGESIAGALKYAKALKYGQQLKYGVCGVRTKDGEPCQPELPQYWTGLTMEGDAADVEALSLMLDIGDISGMDEDVAKRKNVLDHLFMDYPGVADELWSTNQHALMRLHEAKTTLEPVRIWICDSNPTEQCGLFFICHLMRDAQTPISVVHIPEMVERGDTLCLYHSSGEVRPEDLGRLAGLAVPMSRNLIGCLAMEWRELVRENAPLRAVLNGSLVGVPEDFYDFALRANMPDGEFIIARLIGSTLHQLHGVGDLWLYLRVKAMLEAGELAVVMDGSEDHHFSSVLRKC